MRPNIKTMNFIIVLFILGCLLNKQSVLADKFISKYWPVNAPKRHWELCTSGGQINQNPFNYQ